jgi:hypothetical protein
MPRSITSALVAMLLIAVAMPTSATAQARIGVHTGLNFEGTDLLIGGNVQFGIEAGNRNLLGQVGVEIYPFIKDTFASRINLNALIPLVASAGAELYGGGGLMVQLSRYDIPEGVNVDDTDTDFGINLVAGAILSGADKNYRPFVEINQTIGGGTDFAARVGIFLKLVK